MKGFQLSGPLVVVAQIVAFIIWVTGSIFGLIRYDEWVTPLAAVFIFNLLALWRISLSLQEMRRTKQ